MIDRSPASHRPAPACTRRSDRTVLPPGEGAVPRMIPGLLLAAVALVLLPTPAPAYLSPDSSSILLQLLLGGAAGIAVLLRVWWRRIAAWLGSWRAGSKRDDHDG